MKSKVSSLVLLVLMFTAYFGFFAIPFNIYSLVAIAGILAVYSYLVSGMITINKRLTTWIVYIIVLISSALLSFNLNESFKYVLFFFCIWLASLSVNSFLSYRWYYIFIGLSFIQTIFIVLHFLVPSLINQINAIILPEVLYSSMYNSFTLSSHAGIAGDLSNAMFFSMSLAMFGFISFLYKNKSVYLLLTTLGMVGIFLAGKRSGLVILVMVVVVIYSVYTKKHVVSKIHTVSLISLFILSFIYLLYYTNLGSYYFEKNTALQLSGDLSNGRIFLNTSMYKIFKENPIFGIGSLSTTSYYGSPLGHNIYMQTLSENGILGFLSFVLLISTNFFNSLKDLYNEEDVKVERKIIYSIYIQSFFIIYGFFGNPLYGAVYLIPYILFTT